MEALITWVKALPGLEIITFTVVSENRPAKALYKNWAFKSTEPIRARCKCRIGFSTRITWCCFEGIAGEPQVNRNHYRVERGA